MFERIAAWLRGIYKRMIGTSSIKSALQVDIALSPVMSNALTQWSQIYAGDPPWATTDVPTLNLGVTIASEIARAATIEMKVTLGTGPRATFLQTELERLLSTVRQQLEAGCAKGSLIFKPYVVGRRILIDVVHADQFYPVSFDADGGLQAVVFVDQRQVGQWWYTRLEYHAMQGTDCLIRHTVFRSSTRNDLGNEASLTEVDDWRDLVPEATIYDIQRPLYGYFKFPLANNIDAASPLGVSCFSRALPQLRHADEIYANLVWEFESGKRAMYVDELAFDQDSNNKPILPDKRLYRTLDMAGSVIGDGKQMFQAWTPEFREAAIKAGLNDVKREIEFLCGLAYGTISDVQVQDKTATEIKVSRQRSYATVTDTQKALRTALDQTLYAMDVWTTHHALASAGTYTATYDFDDSVIVDRDAQMVADRQSVTMGVMPKFVFLMRNYGMDENAARDWIAQVQSETPAQDFFGEGGA